jgi:uncharacterized protein (TIGR02246 family)
MNSKLSLLGVALLCGASITTSCSRGSEPAPVAKVPVAATDRSKTEAEIQVLVARLVRAIQERDLDGVMSVYAPNLVAFDVVPPLEYVGAEAYRKPWQEVFERFQGPIEYGVRNLSITAGDDVAFSYSLNRIAGTTKDGHKTELWLRATTGYRKTNGQWQIAHLQVSAPVDLASGKAALDLKP